MECDFLFFNLVGVVRLTIQIFPFKTRRRNLASARASFVKQVQLAFRHFPHLFHGHLHYYSSADSCRQAKQGQRILTQHQVHEMKTWNPPFPYLAHFRNFPWSVKNSHALETKGIVSQRCGGSLDSGGHARKAVIAASDKMRNDDDDGAKGCSSPWSWDRVLLMASVTAHIWSNVRIEC
ncbi:uncharacterized protein BCR38DRAFT_442848 [Pseudomassariella vexata]|uniref:Uncharacterized protein n=1 Tax=Pseudomassariella vexata TaxID=1141098 RepID=A0A1Y2DNQ4_9PEZI|nr:uncharacterized protein BCR38DRAFT_442848 [Pseudomassariella vexata]ORY60902.1 hypothetical protein BCR38DRAFT_442848 [Pseudomassariella vexata]